MHLEHYRCFRNLKISFDDRLTVLIGENGAGKTAVLDSLSIYLQVASQSAQPYIPIRDIMINSKPSDIIFNFEISGLHDALADKTSQIEFSYDRTISDAIVMKTATETGVPNKKITPLFVSYMARRSIPEEEGINAPPEGAAFANNFKRTIDYSSTIHWFNNADADEARAMRDGQKSESPELSAVRYALSKALLGQYERPRMIGSPPELILYRKGTDIYYKVSQLSDGYRVMLALVMDLARRMAQTSHDCGKSGEQLLHVPAIVLIDEVELHLHPSWQKTVLTTLMEIFQNTQFIVTTHSPQVLTSIPSKHIRILSDGKAHIVDEQTEGAESSRVLENILGVEQRPEKLSIVQTLETYKKLVYDEKWDTAEAEQLRKKLVNHYGNDEPELERLELHIENAKWERGL